MLAFVLIVLAVLPSIELQSTLARAEVRNSRTARNDDDDLNELDVAVHI